MTRRTKIVCTIGPATEAPERLESLIAAGMNVARLNLSHGNHQTHGEVIGNIRAIASRLGQPVAILLDLAGPKLRIGPIAGGPVALKPGQEFTLTLRNVAGSDREVSLTHPALVQDVRKGDALLLADGAIELVVEKIDEGNVHCRVIVGGEIDSHKGINVPSRTLSLPALSEKDEKDLLFGLEQGVDYIALSFIRSADEVTRIRKLVREQDCETPLIAKIEKREALADIDRIIAEVDGIMIARGDLGVEIPIERIPRVQKELIAKANRAGIPVITATQMLKSMVECTRPTRAEVTDVANAILDGSGAVMLSEETAVGRHAVGAVQIMSRIAVSTEEAFPFGTWASRFDSDEALSMQDAVARAACRMARQVKAAAIITNTQSGSTTRLVSKCRPSQPILAITPDETTYRRLALVWGAVPLLIDASGSAGALEEQSLDVARHSGFLEGRGRVVITAGLPLHVTGTTNSIRVLEFGDGVS
jgi:pyruvate kinase